MGVLLAPVPVSLPSLPTEQSPQPRSPLAPPPAGGPPKAPYHCVHSQEDAQHERHLITGAPCCAAKSGVHYLYVHLENRRPNTPLLRCFFLFCHSRAYPDLGEMSVTDVLLIRYSIAGDHSK